MGVLTRILVNALVVSVAVLAGFYQFYLKSLLLRTGISPARVIQPLGNEHCKKIPKLQACEELILHQPSGLVYFACSTPSSRAHWIPAMEQFNTTGASFDDYVATYDPTTSRITRLTTTDFHSERGLSLHGIDVVASTLHSEHLYIYLVNHRKPLGNVSAYAVGADSVIEIFETAVGSTTMKHVRTVENPVISTPNSVIGSPDGKSFYFTNDHGVRVGLVRSLDMLGRRSSSVGYCHIDEGCKIALSNTFTSNGITAAPNGTIYVANGIGGIVDAFEPQTDNTLALTDSIKTDYILDNLSVDADGQLWAAAVPKMWSALQHMKSPSKLSPSMALRISINTGPNAFYGEKYKVSKMFEDDGKIIPLLTSVSYDSERRKLYLGGIAAPHSVVCDL
ncbi:calcium-dependent phosphotriesterase [Pholiota conissans]|uniref:Calcium-dependent phosphotriesterase n=1 Tax=Pholiota conissans TaxID=109636 RepID=A0A9P6CVW1_9AGAR|nr:calcium-dependent phosphotriesterase [Pholiota conissans]